MKKIGFYFVFSLLWIVTLLPFRVLYFLSDLLFILIFHLIAYRKKVVLENLSYAFPEKDIHEIKSISRKFYRHFCDSLLESAKILHLSKPELERRFTFKNLELLNKLYDENKSVVLVSGHYGNWEWMIGIQMKLKHKFLAIYKPLASDNFDVLINKLRKKYAHGGEMVAMQDVYKSIITHTRNNLKVISWFLADQTPPANYPYWTSFMNRETPFYSGPARIAIKFKQPLVYLQINKLKRGFYSAEFSMLCKNPGDYSEEEIIAKYVQSIENTIKMKPEYWLWSHRRWKHKKENLNHVQD